MRLTRQPVWTLVYVILIVVLVLIGFLAAKNFDAYQLNPISNELVLGILIPIMLIALFLERAQEIFISAWRDMDRTPLEQSVDNLKKMIGDKRSDPANAHLVKNLESAEAGLSEYKGKTKRLLFFFSLLAGVCISAVGIRVLRPLTIADTYASGSQPVLFNLIDILLTGALIGGGSEGVHRVASVFTDALDKTRAKIKEK